MSLAGSYSSAPMPSGAIEVLHQSLRPSRIIGYIRQAAISEALISFDQRVDNAMEKIYALLNWSKPQRNWLNILGGQLDSVMETLVTQLWPEAG